MTKKRPHDAKNRSEENIHRMIQYEFKKCNGRNRDILSILPNFNLHYIYCKEEKNSNVL